MLDIKFISEDKMSWERTDMSRNSDLNNSSRNRMVENVVAISIYAPVFTYFGTN